MKFGDYHSHIEMFQKYTCQHFELFFQNYLLRTCHSPTPKHRAAMNVSDIPNLVKAAVPESKGRNVRIISDNRPSHRDPGFLSKDFPRSPPKLYVTAEDDDFDELTLAEWRDEGFDVEYIPMGNGGEEYRQKIRSLSKRKMDPCTTFGIVGG